METALNPSSPQVIRTCREMQDTALRLRAEGRRIGLVPTMGYLHEGHLSLVRLARAHCDVVVVSIFVNPTQFGPREDLATYPRDLPRDLELCRSAQADLVFVPEASDVYPSGHSTYVVEEALGGGLCGRSRPGHFRGVCTVVAALYHLCLPHVAVFGEKDAQQLRILRRMTRDLHFPLRIIPGPIVREPDGVAMSSRNAYLTREERAQAPVLRRALDEALALFTSGERGAGRLLDRVRAVISTASLARIDYAELVDDDTLQPVERIDRPAVLALAVHLGRARLLDNHLLTP